MGIGKGTGTGINTVVVPPPLTDSRQRLIRVTHAAKMFENTSYGVVEMKIFWVDKALVDSFSANRINSLTCNGVFVPLVQNIVA